MYYKKSKLTNSDLSRTNRVYGYGNKNYKILEYIRDNPDCTRLEILEALGYDVTKKSVGARQFWEMRTLGAINVECMTREKHSKRWSFEYRITDYGLKVLNECDGK